MSGPMAGSEPKQEAPPGTYVMGMWLPHKPIISASQEEINGFFRSCLQKVRTRFSDPEDANGKPIKFFNSGEEAFVKATVTNDSPFRLVNIVVEVKKSGPITLCSDEGCPVYLGGLEYIKELAPGESTEFYFRIKAKDTEEVETAYFWTKVNAEFSPTAQQEQDMSSVKVWPD